MLIDPWKEIIVKLTAVLFQLRPCQITQLIVCLANELLSVEEGVDEETSARDLSRQPAMEARVELALGHGVTLHSAEARPVGDSEVRDPS